MSNFKITCADCNQPIAHVCDEKFRDALMRLLTWVPQGCWSSPEMAKAFEAESKRQQDEHDFSQLPFFGSQAWTYLIWHKEDARTFHALLHNMMRAAGLDPNGISEEVGRTIRAREQERAEAAERTKRFNERRAQKKAEK